MNYKQSLRYLNSFIDYERLKKLPGNSKFNLGRMKHLLDLFDLSGSDYPTVLIAGTVGKGSAGFFLENILSSHGLKTGFYSSPHLMNIRERIRVNGKSISEKKWSEAFQAIKRRLSKAPVPRALGKATFFEIMTLAAALAFRQNKTQATIFEVGLGGRLDAVNALESEIQIITKIDFDHEQFLGGTLGKIATEKAGIIKKGARVISAPQKKESELVLRRAARKQEAVFEKVATCEFAPALLGHVQHENVALAVEAARAILGECFSEARARKALRSKNWPGRLEWVSWKGRRLLLDVAHNPASVSTLVKYLKDKKLGGASWLIFSALQDKSVEKILKALSAQFDRIIVTEVANPRTQALGELARQASAYFREVVVAAHAREALELYKGLSETKDRAVICGSFYLVGEMKQMLQGRNRGKN